MKELSCFLDESGSDNLRDRYHLLTLVLHEQSDSIQGNIAAYERSLAERGLPDILFHAGPLMTGHGPYEGMDIRTRKRLLSAFRVLFRHMPIRHATFAFRMSEFSTPDDFFVLSSGLAGEILQKYVNYQMKLAIYGDFSGCTSKPLHDFIYESNKGRDFFFAGTREEAIDRLA